MIRVDEIHARIGTAWPAVLAQLGIPEDRLRKKAGPCPACGGTDRFTFDNRHHRGDFYCRHCGAGSGFDLLMRVHGWDFGEARRRVIEAIGLASTVKMAAAPVQQREPTPATPTARVHRLLRESCHIADCADAISYLEHRRLWPLLPGCAWRAHPSVEYFHDGQRIGRFPALIAIVTDIDRQIVTAHITYLRNGRKLEPHEPRKLLSPLTGRMGCSVRLMSLSADVLGIGEGIETVLSAARIHDVPVWAALNATLLAKFTPPAEVRRLLTFADRDAAGLEAAARLMERLQGRVALELRVPRAPAKDWNETGIHHEQ